jgi:LacI family transcriptional regulator
LIAADCSFGEFLRDLTRPVVAGNCWVSIAGSLSEFSMTIASQKSVLLALSRYSASTHMGVARFACERNWHLNCEMAFTGRLPEGWRGDGIIAVLDQREEVVEFVRRAKVPVVDLSVIRPDIKVPRVSGDHRAIGQTAGELFLERGFQHFAWFTTRDDPAARLREQGFLESVRPQAVTAERWVFPESARRKQDEWTVKSEWLIKRLRAIPKPAAVFAFHDAEAANVLDACLLGGIDVPEEVSILGVDDNPMICESVRVHLSSVKHDLEGLGYVGATLLDGLMRGEKAPRTPILIPPRGITERRSTDALAVTNTGVRKALEFMRRNYPRLIGPEDAAEEAGMPRAQLETEFRKLFHHSMRAELARIRLQRAKEYLLGTDLPVADVAARTGFNTAQYFNNVFRRETGFTPLNYRRERTQEGQV